MASSKKERATENPDAVAGVGEGVETVVVTAVVRHRVNLGLGVADLVDGLHLADPTLRADARKSRPTRAKPLWAAYSPGLMACRKIFSADR